MNPDGRGGRDWRARGRGGMLLDTHPGIEEARRELFGVEEVLMDQDQVRTMSEGSAAHSSRMDTVVLAVIASSRTICPRRHQIRRVELDLPKDLKRHLNNSLQRPHTILGKDLSRCRRDRMTLTPYDQSGQELSKFSTGKIVTGSNSSHEISMTMVSLVVNTWLLS
jgi:hypothetical protein